MITNYITITQILTPFFIRTIKMPITYTNLLGLLLLILQISNSTKFLP